MTAGRNLWTSTNCWQADIIFEEDDFQNGYKDYRNLALANQEYLGNRKSSFTRATLTDAFRVLKNIDSIIFLGFEATYHSFVYSFVKQVPEPFKCSIQPYKGYENDERRRVIAAPVGDALFEIGIDSLAKTEVCVQSLKIKCAMTGHFGWKNITGWEKLDLSRLQTLKFDPWTTSQPSYSISDRGTSYYEDAIAVRASDAITEVMKKCKNSLEVFTYGRYSPMIWPGAQVIPLPNLKKLSLENGYLEPKNTQRVCIPELLVYILILSFLL